jgi:hypothetical protein
MSKYRLSNERPGGRLPSRRLYGQA